VLRAGSTVPRGFPGCKMAGCDAAGARLGSGRRVSGARIWTVAMNAGYAYMFLALAGFSLIGIFSKVADMKNCRPAAIYAFVYLWSLVLVAGFVVFFKGVSFEVPKALYRIALPFGMSAAIAGIAFQAGLRYGKISTSWLIINLSAAIPTIGSIAFYHEQINNKKILAFCLVTVSMLLLWIDRKTERPADKPARDKEENAACG